MKKTNRIYGLVGVTAQMSMWNADMTLGPKQVEDTFFGSDKALKYAIKDFWRKQGAKIIYIKHRDKEYQLQNLRQVYESEFNESLPDKKDTNANIKVLKNILTCPDVRNFGCTFAVDNVNLGITGAVQVGQGLNIYPDSTHEVIDILSPFVNSAKAGTMTSIGSKHIVNEAHYLYPFTVNPSNYKELEETLEGFEGYTEEDWEHLKDALLKAVTALDTNSKTGCENSFALFVNCKNDSKLFLSNLNSYVTMDKNRTIDITALQEHLEPVLDEIDSVEIYYNNNLLTLNYKEDSKYIVKNMYCKRI